MKTEDSKTVEAAVSQLKNREGEKDRGKQVRERYGEKSSQCTRHRAESE